MLNLLKKPTPEVVENVVSKTNNLKNINDSKHEALDNEIDDDEDKDEGGEEDETEITSIIIEY